jgi:Domain of Unknown Function (DUF908)
LLGSTDLDVLENALRLISCFAARTAQKPESASQIFAIPKRQLWMFATGEAINSRQPPFPDLKSLLSPSVVIPPNWSGYHFHYYKRSPTTPTSSLSIPPRSSSNTQTSPLVTTTKPRDSSDSWQKASDASESKVSEGWVRLQLNPENIAKNGIEPTLRELVAQANIPKDDEYRLFIQILQVYYYHSPIRREQFLRCQLIAIVSLGTILFFFA